MANLTIENNAYRNKERLGFIAKMFISILLIVIFEGAIRKWISNGSTYFLIGLRDFLAVYAIVWAFIYNKFRSSPRQFQQLSLFTVLLVIWGTLQVVINESSLLVYLVGLRFWILYLWFGFIAGISITERDFNIISKLLVLLMVGMVPLVLMQHFLPPSSFWNKQLDEGGPVFLVSRDIVRVTSTFSFTAGYSAFLTMVGPFVFLSLDPARRFWQNKWMSYLVTLSLLISTIVSGSRTAIIVFGFYFLVYAISNMRYAKGKKKGQTLLIVIAVMAALSSSLTLFSRAADATRERFETASKAEDPVDRVIHNILPEGDFEFIGVGIGKGNNFSATLETGVRQFTLAEAENPRIVMEAGLLGLAVVVVKALFAFRGGRMSLRIAKRTGSTSILVIWAAVSIALLMWQLTFQLTINALGFLLLGLGIAALRLERTRIMSCK